MRGQVWAGEPNGHSHVTDSAAAESEAGCMSATGVSNKLEILLVHADRWVRAELGDLLRQSGHSVVEMSNGAGGLRYVATPRPDLIVIGPSLAEVSRAELLELLRVDLITRAIPIITVGCALEEFERTEPLLKPPAASRHTLGRAVTYIGAGSSRLAGGDGRAPEFEGLYAPQSPTNAPV
jgi:CheY-like chemotaxis protein